jgi:hypothetical protein
MGCFVLFRHNYIASKLIHSLYPEEQLRTLLTQEQSAEDARLGLAVECLSFHVFNQVQWLYSEKNRCFTSVLWIR